MGRPPIGEKAMTNAEKQKNYRRRLEERRIRMQKENYTLKNDNRNLRYDNHKLVVLLADGGEDEYEKLKKENERLKAENKRLMADRKPAKEKKDGITDVIERAQARSTSGAWTKK